MSWGAYGKRPLAVLCLVGLVDAIDRGVLPGVLPFLQEDLGISDAEAGLLNTALVVAALLLAVPGGLLSDRLDRRRLITGVLGLWAAATAAGAACRSLPQLFAVRAALGAGDAINEPAAQSLVADYYPLEIRGRAYGYQRVVPVLGAGLGLGIGAGLGELFGWRVAFLAVGVPGVLVAILVHRLPLPPRGGEQAVETSTRTSRESVRAALAVPSLRALLLAAAFANGMLSALAFWGVTYHVRASGLSEAQAGGLGGGVILLGAIAGGLGGGVLADRLREPAHGMIASAALTAAGTVLLLASFLDGLPVYAVRLPLQMLACGLIVAALPAVTVLTTLVVGADLRGTAFGLLKLASNVLAAASPPLIGLLADAHEITLPDGEVKGDLGLAFRWTMWTVLLGSVALLLGRRHVARDIAAVDALQPR